jgi:hypothetical protein
VEPESDSLVLGLQFLFLGHADTEIHSCEISEIE